MITSVKIEQADHTQVIDTAATKFGLAANKAFLFFIHKEIQGWRNFKTLISWGLSKVGETHGPIFDEVKERTVAVYRKGCQQETAFVQALIKTQLTDRIDAHWKLHDQVIAWFKDQTQGFQTDNSVEDISEVEAEESITILDASTVPVLDPPVADPLDDELSIPEDSAPVPVTTGSKRRSAKKKVEASLSEMIRKEAAKSS